MKKTKAVAKKTDHKKAKADPMQSLIIQGGVVFVVVAGFLLLMYVVKFYY